MKGFRSTALVLIVATFAVAAALPSTQVSAITATVTIGSATANVGEEVSVDLRATGLAEPGLGAWTVDITYDSSVVSFAACQPGVEVTLCGPSYGVQTDRITGAQETGWTGDVTLATMTYRCGTPGLSVLDLDISVFADASDGGAQDIEEAVVNGAITCVGSAAGTGDVDCDGSLKSIDAALVLQSTTTLLDALPCEGSADVNGDGHINAIDALLILQYVAGLIDSLPP